MTDNGIASYLYGLVLGGIIAGSWSYAHQINYGKEFPGAWFVFAGASILAILSVPGYIIKD